jgi:hypothetical protein
MATSCVLVAAAQASLADKLNSDLGGGSIKIYTNNGGTLLATIPLKATTIGTNSNGVITIDCTNTTQASADGTGTATYANLCKSDGTAWIGVNVSTSGASINLVNTSIAATQTVTITSGTITVPAGT